MIKINVNKKDLSSKMELGILEVQLNKGETVIGNIYPFECKLMQYIIEDDVYLGLQEVFYGSANECYKVLKETRINPDEWDEFYKIITATGNKTITFLE